MSYDILSATHGIRLVVRSLIGCEDVRREHRRPQNGHALGGRDRQVKLRETRAATLLVSNK